MNRVLYGKKSRDVRSRETHRIFFKGRTVTETARLHIIRHNRKDYQNDHCDRLASAFLLLAKEYPLASFSKFKINKQTINRQ